MKSLLSAFILSAVLLVGCGKSESSSPTTATPTESTEFKVALLTPGPVSDAGWNAMAFDGLKAIESEMKASVSNQEAAGANIKDAMLSYARQGYNLIFGHGFEYNDPAMEVAGQFPDIVFVSSSGSKISSNVGAFRFYLEQGFYLCGYMAAMMSKTGKVAMIGGDKVASIESTFKGFAAGAKAARSSVEVITVFTGDGKDTAKAKQATLAAIEQGADFVIHQANAAAQGVFDACKEKGVYAFGANLDQNTASDSVIASAIIVAKPAFLDLAKSVQEKKFKGEVVLMGMDKQAIDFVISPKHMGAIPEEVKTKLMSLKQQIIQGNLIVPKDQF